mgnify:FL=1
MMKIDSVKDLVYMTLRTEPATRNSDRALIYPIYKKFGVCAGESFEDVLFNEDLPSFETIRRARQKAQADFPNLRADKAVEAFRAERESEFREFARGV